MSAFELPRTQVVQEALRSKGVDLKVVEMPQTTRTAVEAAQAIGCEVSQIAKSLIFKTSGTHRPILVIAGGSNRVNVKKIEELVGEPIEKPDADYVKSRTGFVIGGIPPVGHLEPMPTFLDSDLQSSVIIWAAAGSPFAVFPLTPTELHLITDGQWVSVS